MKIHKYKSAQFAVWGINFQFLTSDYTIEISFFDWALPARLTFDPLGWRTSAQIFCLNFTTMHFKDWTDEYDEDKYNPIITEDDINFINDEPELKRWK